MSADPFGPRSGQIVLIIQLFGAAPQYFTDTGSAHVGKLSTRSSAGADELKPPPPLWCHQSMSTRHAFLDATAAAVVLLWLVAVAGVIRVAEAFGHGLMFPVDGWFYGFGEFNPTWLWPVPAGVGAMLGVSMALIGLVRPSPGLYRQALTVVTIGSLVSLNDRALFGDHAVSFAVLGIAANAQSLGFSAAALGCIFVLYGIGIVRTQPNRMIMFGLSTASLISFSIAVYAQHIQSLYYAGFDMYFLSRCSLQRWLWLSCFLRLNDAFPIWHSSFTAFHLY